MRMAEAVVAGVHGHGRSGRAGLHGSMSRLVGTSSTACWLHGCTDKCTGMHSAASCSPYLGALHAVHVRVRDGGTLSIWMKDTLRYRYAALLLHSVPANRRPIGRIQLRVEIRMRVQLFPSAGVAREDWAMGMARRSQPWTSGRTLGRCPL